MKSPSKTVLIAAVSGRALAQASQRAGYRPLVADFFQDLDTVGICARTALLPGGLRDGIDPRKTLASLRALADGEVIDSLVLGSGFERLPSLVDELARHFDLAGNTGETIARVKNPETFALDCEAIGVPHPAIRREKPIDLENWVMKVAGAAGGTHVRPASTDQSPGGRYYQQRLSGPAVSCLFIASQHRAHLIGFSRQWQSPLANAPYRYGGAVRLTRFPRKDRARIGQWLDGLVSRTGLRGLCSADFIRSAEGYSLLEINPRPGATLDIFDTTPTPLLEAHIHACRGEKISLARTQGSVASMIAYADQALTRLPSFEWPRWSADHQAAGSRLDAGDPVCTVFGAGPNAAAARQDMQANARLLEHNWLGNRP